ncbi:hypothetical protein [Sediminibacterium goheungense]|nr:hypothetical protein [Sediminibacterium goheungense]
MKKLCMLGVFIGASLTGFTQCEKASVSKTSTGRFIQENAKQPDFPFEGTVTIGNGKIILNGNIAGQPLSISNTISNVALCNWKEYLQNGQAVYKVSTDKGNGNLENSIITITGKDGKVKILFTSESDEKSGLELDIVETQIEKT